MSVAACRRSFHTDHDLHRYSIVLYDGVFRPHTSLGSASCNITRVKSYLVLLPSQNNDRSTTRVTAHTYESLSWFIVVAGVSVKMGGYGSHSGGR